ncbi:RagB/SusD family nutrient uptake outer membrane protein [Poritiphilus flavus]|uniref:RagB/SusD family nutrient uptake outer membrane protein n=1 Tax=Poritiphilus flavus TaxID=2697053 RepID=A0A6L9E855_9FLAO|nr:RagB/SusD family nutrient uptake outer membrane protein [Poritiphilus flavus]NAS10788.1 RagB/SusD family nutrient uptake outer membrane protein [Poritiphilus flavus]
MKTIKSLKILGASLLLFSCSLDEVTDPNQPSIGGVLGNPTEETLNFLAQGLESKARSGWGGYITATGSIARELYDFNASDPTTTATLIGKEGVQLTGSEPQLTGTMFARYQAVKNADFILDALADAPVTDAQKNGYRGLALTYKAYMLLDVLNLLGDNGVRIDVSDPNNLGPFVSRAEGFQALRTFLDDGFAALQSGEFAMEFSTGFDGFNTPATFAQFNRAVAARVAIHQEDYAGALSLLQDSFLSLDAADLAIGPKRIYAQGGTELLNPIFKAPQQSGDQYIVHDRFINDIQAGDTRIDKFRMRDDPVARDGLNGTHEIDLYASATTPIDHIRNEELILIYAEASIQQGNLTDAVDALNIIRNAYGLGDYAGTVAAPELTDEMLYNRAYSLWAEGHAMFDLRRYDRLNATFLPIDRAGDIIHTQFPIPPFEEQ